MTPSGEQRFQPDGKHGFLEMGEGEGSVLPAENPKPGVASVSPGK